MTPEQIQLIRDSWAMVSPIRTQAAELFYGRLFELDPSLRSLFSGDIAEQGEVLMAMLGFAVRNLDALDTAVPRFQYLGVRHAGYGVEAHHYDTVAQALLWTLEQGLGDAATPAVLDAWTVAYTTLATVMQEAAASSSSAQVA